MKLSEASKLAIKSLSFVFLSGIFVSALAAFLSSDKRDFVTLASEVIFLTGTGMASALAVRYLIKLDTEVKASAENVKK